MSVFSLPDFLGASVKAQGFRRMIPGFTGYGGTESKRICRYIDQTNSASIVFNGLRTEDTGAYQLLARSIEKEAPSDVPAGTRQNL